MQANQFLVVDNGTGAIIDLGSNLACNQLYVGMAKHFSPEELPYLLASPMPTWTPLPGWTGG